MFTHLTDHWAGWLAELHRVLRPGGLAIVSFLGGAMYEVWTEEEWDPDRIGMLVLNYGQDWELGGPTVFHSPWWLHEHWGRAFEIVELREGTAPREHGLVLLRRRAGVKVTPALLERIDPREPREIEALRWQVACCSARRAACAPRATRSRSRTRGGCRGGWRAGSGRCAAATADYSGILPRPRRPAEPLRPIAFCAE